MNKFIERYKELREVGKNEFEAFGTVATHIAVYGTFTDLQTVYGFMSQDLVETSAKEFRQHESFMRTRSDYSNLTSYERDMKLAGMKQSDFL